MLKGKQALKIYIFVFNLFGIPLNLFLIFGLKLEVYGVWIGFGTLTILADIILFVKICRLDWGKQIKLIREKL